MQVLPSTRAKAGRPTRLAFYTALFAGTIFTAVGVALLYLVFGGDWQSNEVWWWENPSPNFDPQTPWKRHLIKKGGKNQHHDQVFGDFLEPANRNSPFGINKPELCSSRKSLTIRAPRNHGR